MSAGIIFTMLSLCACTADNLTDVNNPYGPDTTISGGKKFVSYMAMQLFDSEEDALTTNWNSDDPNADNYFDKGTVNERVLYFPEVKEEEEEGEDEEEEQPENYSRSDDDPTTGEEEDDEPDPSEQFYHFAILFNKDGSLVTDGLTPLELTKEDDSKAGYTLYSKFYSSDEENPFLQDAEFTVLVVLNASYDLQQYLNEKIKSLTKTSDCYSEISKFALDWNNSESLLYLKDKNGDLIKDEVGNPYFTMTSSMVIDSSNKVVPAIETTEGKNLFQTYTSKDLAKDNPTTIYVERLGAKYTVIIKGDDNNYYYLKQWDRQQVEADLQTFRTRGVSPGEESNPIEEEHLIYKVNSKNYKIKIVKDDYKRNSDITQRSKPVIEEAEWWANILGWDINATESEEYLFKSLKPGTDYYEGWNQNPYSTSKNILSYRNFWAEDLNYSTGNYPWQYRKIYKECSLGKDNEGHETLEWIPDISSSHSLSSQISSTLTYNDFTTLNKRDPSRYIVENTFNEDLMNNQGGQSPYYDAVYLRTGSHLIVTAQLLVKGIDDDYIFSNENYGDDGMLLSSGNAEAKSKYYMNDIYWSESAYKNYVAEYLAYFMMDDDNQKDTRFGRNNGNFYVFDSNNMRLAEDKDFEFDHANIKGGDNFVYITPKEGVVLYTFNPDEIEEEEDEENEGEVNDNPGTPDIERVQQNGEIPFGYHAISMDKYLNLVYAHPELMAVHYNAGRMYYVSGSIHNRESHKDYYAIYTGDYGTVRNHWYAFKIDGITSPGTGVDIIDQPIVPNNYNRKALLVSLSVLPWHNIYASVDNIGDQHRPGETN